MKKLGIVMMLTILVVVSSFTPKIDSVHETRVDADIVDLAISQDFLTTLVAAVKAGDLVETLKGDGPFTVFAPTNDAFAKLPAGTVENLLKPENKAQLVKILTYHVVPGKVMSSDLKNGQTAKTVEGSSIKVTLMDGKAMINNATVTAADIAADNGVVHVIDTVIIPPM
ncbi:fasciclin domain-containing protein [Algoriphagus sp. D3-2-R+10]|uniref:fasciclin domain-containing protein n=1 Tax=Algoriphagus aurantiacus TaxID=3103948 RepID=UPI002B377DB2|nr:fasciclin domain-containing protein [Algoriphagus sp. D3-2-R+10]MEB2773712.1 fasciclin domain-containing protein [Algoriphagus sp. D3-2-R+10]